MLLYKESPLRPLVQLVFLAWLSKAGVRRVVMSHEVWRHLAKHPTGGKGDGGVGVEESRNHTRVIDKEWGVEISSAVRVQLCFDVNSTDRTLPAGGQPLVHAALVEEVHAGQSPGGQRETRGQF